MQLNVCQLLLGGFDRRLPGAKRGGGLIDVLLTRSFP